ncbi:MAG: protein translocase subunit SecD [Actinobacteria bacterium]|nr:protein translocase subunit SecD [Actinomycetota bacterium]
MNPRTLLWSLSLILVIAVASVGATFLAGKAPLLGLDLKGGVEVVLQPQTKNTASTTLDEAVTIINNRVNGYGISNASVTKQGSDIVIELPGAKNDTQVLKELGQTAQLFFRPVECVIAPYIPPATSKAPAKTTTGTTTPTTAPPKTAPPKTKGGAGHRKAAKAALGAPGAQLDSAVRYVAARASATKPATGKVSATTTTVPSTTTTTTLSDHICSLTTSQQQSYMPPHGDAHGLTPADWDNAGSTVVLPYYYDFVKGQYKSDARYVLGPAQMTGGIVKSAAANLNSSTGEWEVDLSFTGKGSREFNNYAASYYSCYRQDPSNPPVAVQCPPYGALQAIELDGVIQSAPAIEASSYNGAATISGSSTNPFTSKQAQSLANALTYGSLPVRLVTQTIDNVSPTIGTQSLRAGAIAGAVAVLLVILYLVGYYRALGLIVVLGICVSGALIYAITTLLSATSNLALTLSGVIGVIGSVGVTADSCVIYFERLKEDIRSGRTVRTSVERSFSRAFRTILAADFSSFIAALILYALTVGDVRGFAFFLGLATLLNIVTTYFFTRPLVILIGRRSVGEGGVLGVGRGLGARRIFGAAGAGGGGS